MFDWALNGDELILSGILDKYSGVELWNNRQKFIKSAINIQLSDLEKTDSAGLATLIALYKEAKQKNIPMKIQGAPQQLLDIAEVSGVKDILPFL